MKIVRHRLRPDDRHRRRQEGIDAAHPGRQRPPHLGVEMHNLPGRMHAGISAPGADDVDRFAGNPRQRFLQHILHRTAARLRLPAMKSVPVVFDTKSDAHG